MPFVESFEEFKKRQAVKSVWIRDRNLYFFANGATSNGMDDHRDPPADKWDRLRKRRVYFEFQLKQRQQDYNQFRERTLMQLEWARRCGPGVPCPGEVDKATLQQLHKLVEIAEGSLQRIETQLASAPAEVHKKQREDERYEFQMKLDKLSHEFLELF